MSIANQLKSIDITKLKMSNGRTLAENLYIEANRLRDCIQNRLEIYLHTHPYRYGGTKPTYERTGGLEGSLKVDDFLSIRVVGNSLEIDIFFDDGAIHMSGDGIRTPTGQIWGGTGEEVNTAYLLNYGYRVKKDVWFKDYENFGYREGANFVEDGIDDFNATNTLGIKITKKFNGETIY